MSELQEPALLKPPTNARGKHLSWVLAAAMHVALALFLIYGIRWQTQAPEPVEVELVRSLPPVPAAVPPAPTLEPPPPAPEPPPRVEPKPAPSPPKPEPLPPPKPEIAVKEKEKPVEKPKEKPKPPVPTPAVTPPRIDPFQEELKREAERLDQAKAADKAAQEVKKIREAQASAANKKMLDVWISQIRGKVRGNVVLPPDVKGNPEALFDVTLLPSGEVISVRLTQSSGQPSLDAAVERAILKSSPLPRPEQAELFRRDLELRYRPVEN